jgi:hypothetical protein
MWMEALLDAECPEIRNQFSLMHGRSYRRWKIPMQKGKSGELLVA